jgi:D-glycero-D-manno-heptose 1,7-bisphosphate phosphatase
MRLYLFDLDGTIIRSYMERADKDYAPAELLPGRAARIAELRRVGAKIGIISNQAGVAFGHIAERDVWAKLERVADLLGYAEQRGFARALGFGPALIADGLQGEAPAWSDDHLNCYVCYADARSRDPRYNDPAQVARRKPSGEMLREAMRDAGVGAAQTIYVGDRSEDDQAAADAGVAFAWAENFFNGRR